MLIRRHETIDAVDPVRWDAVAGDPFCEHACLAALERSGMVGVRMRYAVLEDRDGRWVAAAPFARIPIDAGRLTHGLFRGAVAGVRRVRPGFLHTGLTICGAPLSVGNPPARIARGADRASIYRLLAGVTQEFAEEDDSPWRAFKEFDAVDIGTVGEVLARSGWVLAPSESNHRLAVRWDRFDDYLAAIRSAYRSKLTHERGTLERAGVIVDVVPLADASYDRAAHLLYEVVFDRASVQFERLTPEFFVALGRAYPSDTFLIRQRIGGRLVGWVAVLVRGDVVYDLFHGIDYELNGRTPLYFGQLAEVVRFAVGRRAAWLSMGQSTSIAKARFGARAVPLWTALRHESGAITAMLRLGKRFLFPEPVEPLRNVFRGVEEAGERSCATGS